MATNLATLAHEIQLVAFDVDGVFTDGLLIYNGDDSESKAFFVQDGLGIKLLRNSGIKTAIITGRISQAVAKRAKDLGIDHIVQGRDDKLIALKELLTQTGLDAKQVAYMGDDLPDLSAIEFASIGASVCNGDSSVQAAADWVSTRPGGQGAVREFCEAILAAQNKLDEIKQSYRLS